MNLIAPIRLAPDDPAVIPLQDGCTCTGRRLSGRGHHLEHCHVVRRWHLLDQVIADAAARLTGGAR